MAKKKPRKKNTLTPSPSPKWPPVGFKSNGEVFAKIPSAQELISNASNNKKLTSQLAQLVDGVRICEKYSCGAVQVASFNGCTWWEVNAKLVGETSADDLTQRTFGDGEGESVFFALFLGVTFFLITAFLVVVALGVGVAVALAVGDGVFVAASACGEMTNATITSTTKGLITVPLEFSHGKEDTNN